MGEQLGYVKKLVDRLRLRHTPGAFHILGCDTKVTCSKESQSEEVTMARGTVQMRKPVKISTLGGPINPVIVTDALHNKPECYQKRSCQDSSEWDKTVMSSSRKISETGKKKLSMTQSVPLSPTSPTTLERQMAQFHDAQFKVDTLKAELVGALILNCTYMLIRLQMLQVYKHSSSDLELVCNTDQIRVLN